MAFAYPEGECFFQRSSLKNSFFSADKAEDFYGYMLVEYLWNQPSEFGTDIYTYKHTRACTSYRTFEGDPFIGYWSQLPICYGPKHDEIKRRLQHDLCSNKDRLRARVNGASAEPWFMVVPMPTGEERCVWFDTVGFIRGIYIPVTQQADQQYSDLCTYIAINFTRRGKDQKIKRADTSQLESWPCDKLFGLGLYKGWTVGVDVRGTSLLLNLPRKLRNANVYTSGLVSCLPCGTVTGNTSLASGGQLDSNNDVAWKTVAEASTGLELQWKPFVPNPDKNIWFQDTFKNLVMFGLRLIPEFGLIAQVSFTLAWTGLTDFDNFLVALSEVLPGVKEFTPAIKESLRKDAAEMKKYLPTELKKVARPIQDVRTQTEPGTAEAEGVDPDAPQTNPEGTSKATLFVKAQKVLDNSPSTLKPS